MILSFQQVNDKCDYDGHVLLQIVLKIKINQIFLFTRYYLYKASSVLNKSVYEFFLTGLMTAEIHATTIFNFWLRSCRTLDWSRICVSRCTCTDCMRIVIIFHRSGWMCGSP